MSDIKNLSALELSHYYESGELSPEQVVADILKDIDALNQQYNFCYSIDYDGAMAEARRSTERWFRQNPNSPLDGVPTTIKDGLLSRGDITYRGSIANDAEQQSWTIDCPIAARQREAGMINLGKTTMPDFGILASGYSSKHGITRNPWHTDYTTGGSSSGTAASLSCGINPIAVGTDIVGSIRLPASYCGLFGLKPSQGRVPYYPPSAPTLVAGPMSRTVADSALFLNLLSQPDRRDITALQWQDCDYLEHLEYTQHPLRLGLLTDIGFGTKPDPETVAAVEAAARALAELGHSVELIESPFKNDSDRCAQLFYQQRAFTEFKHFDESLRQQSPYIHRFTKQAETVTAPQLFDAINAMRELRAKTMAMFSHIDYLLLPATPTPAFKAELPANDPERLFDPWCNNFLFNITEQPASSINCGYSVEGLPIGLQIVGQRFDDLGVLQLSRLYEKIRPAQKPFPIR